MCRGGVSGLISSAETLWQCGHLSYNDSECICKGQTWQVTQFKLLQFLFVSREEETFPLPALCPWNSAFPFSEGEGKHCHDAAKCQWGWSWDAGNALLAPTAQDQGQLWTLLLLLTWALLPLFPHSYLSKAFGPFPSLFLSFFHLHCCFRSFFGRFASLLVHSSPGMLNWEMAGVTLGHTLVFFLSSSNVSISFFLAPCLRLSHLISTHFQSFQKTFAVFFIFLLHDILKIINLIRRWELFG